MLMKAMSSHIKVQWESGKHPSQYLKRNGPLTFNRIGEGYKNKAKWLTSVKSITDTKSGWKILEKREQDSYKFKRTVGKSLEARLISDIWWAQTDKYKVKQK